MTFPVLTVLAGLPLLAVLVIFCIPARCSAAIKAVALGSSTAALGLAVWLFFAYDRGTAGLQFV